MVASAKLKASFFGYLIFNRYPSFTQKFGESLLAVAIGGNKITALVGLNAMQLPQFTTILDPSSSRSAFGLHKSGRTGGAIYIIALVCWA